MEEGYKAHKERLREAKEMAKRKVEKLAPIADTSVSFYDISEEEEVEKSKNGGKTLWDEFLGRVSKNKGGILLATLMGSKRYNLGISTSDLDLVVIYLPFLSDNIGMKPQPQTFKQFDNLRPDFSVHSLGHFCNLLIDGDSKSVEILFCHHTIIREAHPTWNQLSSWKSRFVTKRVILSYIAELKGAKGLKKLSKLVEDGKDVASINKCAYILMRLILLANRFIAGFHASTLDSVSPIWFDTENDDHKLLMKIRNGEIPAGDLQNSILNNFELLESNLASSRLPESVLSNDIDELGHWYLQLNYQWYKISEKSYASPITPVFNLNPIPGVLMCLYRNETDDCLFGVYCQPLSRKLNQWRGTKDGEVLSGLTLSDSALPLYKANEKFTLYEMDRLTDAILRTELSVIAILHNKQNRIMSTTAWEKIDQILDFMWTNTLLYQLCGYLSGRFKASGGKLEELKNCFSSLGTLQYARLASQLLQVALLDSSPRVVLKPEQKSALEAFHTTLVSITSIGCSLVAKTSNSSDDEKLLSISKTYTKTFVTLRPLLSELLTSEIKFEPLESWFLECRMEAYRIETCR